MRNFENENGLPQKNERIGKENRNACGCNMLAVSVANALYEGKTKEEINRIVSLLHVLIALSKTYLS